MISVTAFGFSLSVSSDFKDENEFATVRLGFEPFYTEFIFNNVSAEVQPDSGNSDDPVNSDNPGESDDPEEPPMPPEPPEPEDPDDPEEPLQPPPPPTLSTNLAQDDTLDSRFSLSRIGLGFKIDTDSPAYGLVQCSVGDLFVGNTFTIDYELGIGLKFRVLDHVRVFGEATSINPTWSTLFDNYKYALGVTWVF